MARESLANEIDIIRMLRTRRFYHLAFKHLLDAPVRKQIKIQSEFSILREAKPQKTSQIADEEFFQLQVDGNMVDAELDRISNVSSSTGTIKEIEVKRLAPFEESPGDLQAEQTSKEFKMRLRSFKPGGKHNRL